MVQCVSVIFRKQSVTFHNVCLRSRSVLWRRMGLLPGDVYAEVPPRVEYTLTETGYSLMPHIESLVGWALEHMTDILERRSIQKN